MLLPIRIYYEDTDCGNVVYYANYLRYFDRGRTEFFRGKGISLPDLHDRGILFVVAKVEVEYLAPCRYNDLLLLDTQLIDVSRVTMTFRHSIRREGSDKELVRGTVVLASVGRDGRPIRMPEEMKRVVG
ncbi:MAG: YbgC/FadM family acyl-CoA thioesterase [Deltaproteobacteria bacterium]|nr:YbgC/FadM family acyl-CoA thioesterase [Deltaproteobacteria bacterium]